MEPFTLEQIQICSLIIRLRPPKFKTALPKDCIANGEGPLYDIGPRANRHYTIYNLYKVVHDTSDDIIKLLEIIYEFSEWQSGDFPIKTTLCFDEETMATFHPAVQAKLLISKAQEILRLYGSFGVFADVVSHDITMEPFTAEVLNRCRVFIEVKTWRPDFALTYILWNVQDVINEYGSKDIVRLLSELLVSIRTSKCRSLVPPLDRRISALLVHAKSMLRETHTD